jgi:uncharacterized protein (TIGR03437 family)
MFGDNGGGAVQYGERSVSNPRNTSVGVNGRLQINAQVPTGVTPGPTVPLTVTVGGVSAR